MLMFVSDGKQVSSGWIDHAREFAERMNAKISARKSEYL